VNIYIELLGTKSRSFIDYSLPDTFLWYIIELRTFPKYQPVWSKLLLRWESWLWSQITPFLYFPGAITHPLSTHMTPIYFHWCIRVLYAVFDNFYEKVKPVRQDILWGGGQNCRFWTFSTLELNYLTNHEVSRALHRRKTFIVLNSV